MSLDALNSNGSLLLKALAVALLLLLLACLKSTACMTLEHTVLATEVAVAETAVSDDTLGRILAILELTADLLGCSASQWKCQVQCAFPANVVVRQCVRRGIKMLASIYEAHILSGKIRTDGEKR